MLNNLKKYFLCAALFGVLSLGVSSESNAATANVTVLNVVTVTPPFGPTYNRVEYGFDYSWSGSNRKAVARLDFYQNNVFNVNLWLNNYTTTPGDITGTTNDQFRATGTGNFYKLYLEVKDTINGTVYALSSKTDSTW